ncbi:phytoene desaturase family protein [Acidicapsa ligni]|uniref:phytoene desaturase family protein n=1 Tax=Acidicapsa ligni TaxID=542300 RepID=UPI0021DF92C7|nr:phytoene desaturase family protein [Acidicapsa ligni]
MKISATSKKSDRVIIIGAGPGGLATAMLLAKAGLEVTVVEKRGTVGGRTSTIEQDGFRFDTGPTFFLYPQVLREIFAATGHCLEKEVPMYRLDPQYRLVFGGGGKIDATPDVEKMKAEIATISPSDASRLENYFRDNREKLQRFAPILQSPFESWRDLVRPEMLRMLPLVRPWRSLDSDLRKYFKDERVRLGFSFQSKYLGMSPFSCPSLFSILSFLEYEHGVFHPVGGCGAVTLAMARIAEKMGVKILLNTAVEEMLFEGRKAVGVRTEHETLHADAVVVNADFAQAMQRMIPDGLRRRWTDKRIAKKQFSCSTFMMYLGIEGRYDDVAHHTIYLSGDYQQNLRDIEHEHTLTTNDASFYVQNACVTDSTLAPEGMSTLYVLFPCTHETSNVDWGVQEAGFRNQALRQLEKIGITDVERRIRVERRFTPATWNSEFHLHLGATFSMAHSLRQMLHLRPHNRFEDLDGVYLVGGGTHPGSGLPVIFESARITSRLLLEDMQLEPGWNSSTAHEGELQGSVEGNALYEPAH